MADTFSRRDFLKLSGAAAAGFYFRDFPPSDKSFARKGVKQLWRTTRSLPYYNDPSIKAKEIGAYFTDTIVKVHEQTTGEAHSYENRVWLHTEEGWLNASYVQPVEERLNVPTKEIPNQGFLAEVTVPFTQAYRITENGKKRGYRFYYGSTYWVLSASTDAYGDIWYQVRDDLKDRLYLVYGPHLRIIPPDELSPISPDVGDKRIEILLDRQMLRAYEGSQQVFAAKVATGAGGSETPRGTFTVERKQPSRHMAADSVEGGGFDLPGVPWVCFILWNGVSLHGTYWHNNYGHVMSHGCINLLPEDAKWIYRWTMPVVPHDDNYEESKSGTLVEII